VEAAVEVLRPAHVFVLLLKAADEAEVKAAVAAKILLFVIVSLVRDCLALCTTLLMIGRIYYLRAKTDRPRFSPHKNQKNTTNVTVNSTLMVTQIACNCSCVLICD
jgi:hypothetical protein